MVVGLLGVLKAGGAYVPLDPAYPPDRLAYHARRRRRPRPADRGRACSTACPALGRGRRPAIDRRRRPRRAPATTRRRRRRRRRTWPTSSTPRARPAGPRGRWSPTAACRTTWPGPSAAYELGRRARGPPVHSSLLRPHRHRRCWPRWSPAGRGRPARRGAGRSSRWPRRSGRSRDYSLIQITPAFLQLHRPTELEPGEAAGPDPAPASSAARQLTAEHARVLAAARRPGTALVNEYGPTETVVGCCVYRVPPRTWTAAGAGPDRPADRQHAALRARPAPAAGAGGRAASCTSAARAWPGATSTGPA